MTEISMVGAHSEGVPCLLEADFKKRLRSFELDVSFRAEGGCLGILGPSGCGKSMTLKAIAGIVRPDSGRIRLKAGENRGGELLFDSKSGVNVPPQKRKVGYLFQNYALFPNMTVEQNIAVGLKGRKDSRRIVAELIERFRLNGLEKQYPGKLSGGQQQRTALARMLAYEPNAMLFDEPFSAMDTFLREGLRLELVKVLKEYHGVSIMVTHDRDEAYQLCDHLLLMDEGKVIAEGETREVFDNPRTVSAARLTGCKNISRIQRIGDYRVKALDWDGLELVCGSRVEDRITSIGIRAHDFEPLGEAEAEALKSREDANLIQVADPDISEMPFEWYVMLRNGLWWKIGKEMRTHEAAEKIPAWLRIKPSAVLLLK